jgi:hypothetical protein
MPSDVHVPRDQERTISIRDADAGDVTYLRPRSVTAFKAAVGFPPEKPLRLNDPDHFERVKEPGKNVVLDPTAAVLGGLSPTQVRGIVASLPNEGRIPERVMLRQFLRTRAFRESVPPGWVRPPEPDPRDILRVVRQTMAGVPDWIRDRSALLRVMFIGKITVEANATLSLDSDITSLVVTEITMHAGSRIVQRAPSLTVSVIGTMQGLGN